jgi:aryl-alcohol dehydrogenase-like predicted oxidoreductase
MGFFKEIINIFQAPQKQEQPIYEKIEEKQIKKILEELIGLKLVKSIGVSVYSNDEAINTLNADLISIIQLPYNLLDNYNKRSEILKLAKELNKKVQSRSVFLQGLFFLPKDELTKKLMTLGPYLDTIKSICSDFNLDVSTLAMGYVKQTKQIDQVILGVDSIEQLLLNLKQFENDIPLNAIKEIDKINVIEEELLLPMNWK